jgi:hypothetical protein
MSVSFPTIRISFTCKTWRKKAFCILNELNIDKLEAWRLRDAPFDFQRIESLQIHQKKGNYDALVKKFPVRRPGEREKSDILTKIDVEKLSCVVEWAPKFGSRLRRLDLYGPDSEKFDISARLLSGFSSSPAADSIQDITITNANDAMFSSALRFPDVTHLRLYQLRISAGVDPASFVSSLASIFPNVSYLLIHLGEAARVKRPALFAQLKSFGRLQTLAFGDSFLDYATSYPGGPELSWFIVEAATVPSTVELRVVRRESSRQWEAETLPTFAWMLGWDVDYVLELETKFPRTPERPRPIYALIRRLVHFLWTRRSFIEQAKLSLDLWCRLPSMESFALVSSTGESVLSIGLYIFDLDYVKTIARKTYSDIQQSHLNLDDTKVWSELSPAEKSEDRAILLASLSKTVENSAGVLEYVTSDEFPGALRAFLNRTARVDAQHLGYGPIVTCLDNYNVPGIVVLLRAGVPPLAFSFQEGLIIIQSSAVLEHALNLQVLEMLWPATQPHMTSESLSEQVCQILRIAGSSWKCSLPNLPQLVQFFLDKGAKIPRSKAAVSYAARCSAALSIELFRLIANANKDHLDTKEWTHLRLDRLSDIEYHVECLEVLVEHGADLTTGLSPLFAFRWQGNADKLPPVVKFLLDRGADPNAKDRDGFEAIQRFAVHCPGGRVPTSGEDSAVMQKLVDLFLSKGVSIPEPSQDILQHIQNLIDAQKRFYEEQDYN